MTKKIPRKNVQAEQGRFFSKIIFLKFGPKGSFGEISALLDQLEIRVIRSILLALGGLQPQIKSTGL